MSIIIATILGIIPYAGWMFVFYLLSRKKVKSPIYWVLIFTAKLFLIAAIIYISKGIILNNLGYFFVSLSIVTLSLPFIANKLFVLLQS